MAKVINTDKLELTLCIKVMDVIIEYYIARIKDISASNHYCDEEFDNLKNDYQGLLQERRELSRINEAALNFEKNLPCLDRRV